MDKFNLHTLKPRSVQHFYSTQPKSENMAVHKKYNMQVYIAQSHSHARSCSINLRRLLLVYDASAECKSTPFLRKRNKNFKTRQHNVWLGSGSASEEHPFLTHEPSYHNFAASTVFVNEFHSCSIVGLFVRLPVTF